MSRNIKQKGKKFLGIIVLLLAMVLFVQLINLIFKVPCLSLYILNVPCPFCGMTRAHIAFLHGDFYKAFSYNPLFFLGIPTLYFICDDDIGKKYPKFYKCFLIVSFSLLFVMNIMRIFGLGGLVYIK